MSHLFVSLLVVTLIFISFSHCKQIFTNHVGVAVQYDNTEELQKEHEFLLSKIRSIINKSKYPILNENENENENENNRKLLPLFSSNKTYQTSLVALHNYYRNITANGKTPNQPLASNMNEYSWDDALASVAQGWADNCIWNHNANRSINLFLYTNEASFYFDKQSDGVGENLYAFNDVENYDAIINGVFEWYNEYPSYTFANHSCLSGVECGHYTQVIWDDTRYVGCGVAQCPTIEGLGWINSTLVVCDYYPAGNYARTPYVNGSKTCGDCSEDRHSCENGLCSGCMSPYWNMCQDTAHDCYNLVDDCESNCSLTNENEYCQKCRFTCGSCTSEMLDPVCTSINGNSLSTNSSFAIKFGNMNVIWIFWCMITIWCLINYVF